MHIFLAFDNIDPASFMFWKGLVYEHWIVIFVAVDVHAHVFMYLQYIFRKLQEYRRNLFNSYSSFSKYTFWTGEKFCPFKVTVYFHQTKISVISKDQGEFDSSWCDLFENSCPEIQL